MYDRVPSRGSGAGGSGDPSDPLVVLRARLRAEEDARHLVAGRGVDLGATGAVGEAVASLRRLDGVAWAELREGVQLELLERLGSARELAERHTATALATAHVLGTAEVADGLPAKAWLAHRSGCARSTAARLLSLGRTLGRFPLFAEAVTEGRLSVDHAHVLASGCNPRVIDKLVAIDTELRDLAVGSTVEVWRRHLRTLVELVDADGAPPPDPREVDTVTLTGTLDGRVLLAGEFSGDQAVVVRHLVDAEVDRQRRAALSDAENAGVPMPSAGVLRARAVMELFRRAAAHGPGDGSKPDVEAVVVIDTTRTTLPMPDGLLGWDPELRRLTPLPHSDLSHATPPHTGPSHIGTPHIGTPHIGTPDGEPIAPHAAALLACDALFGALAVDGEGRPLRYGRNRRTPSREQRIVLANRDGGCVFPGCDAPPRWCDAHHVTYWSTGGTTDIEVLALLCRRHHGLAHSADWTLEVDPCNHETARADQGGDLRGRPPDRPAPPGPPGPGAGRTFDPTPAPACPADPACPGSHTFTWTHHRTGRRIPAQNARTRGRRPAT